jgi:hypothetical protein
MEIECKNNNNAFWPKVSNITLKRAAATLTENNSAEYDAIQFKNQGNGEYSNVLIDGYSNPSAVAVRIQDANTNNNQVNASKIKLTNVKINGTTPQFGGTSTVTSIVFPAGQYTTSTTSTGASLTNGAWSTVNGATLLQ